MKQKKLSSKQVRYLRGLGHHLSPVAIIGQHGLTEQVVKAVDEVLLTHELVKIKKRRAAFSPGPALLAVTHYLINGLGHGLFNFWRFAFYHHHRQAVQK